MGYSLAPFSRVDIDEAAELHLEAFPSFFLSSLGAGFLWQLYAYFAQDETAVGFSARDDAGWLVGVVVGTTEPEGFFRRALVKRWWQFGFAAAGAVLTRPSVIPRLVRAVTHRGDVPGEVSGALLSSICVEPDFNGSGLAVALIEAWTEQAAAMGARSAYLTTDALDNDRVNAFYKKVEWRLASSFETPEGRLMNCYAKTLP